MAVRTCCTVGVLLLALLLIWGCGSTSTESVTGPSADKCQVALTAPDATLDAAGGVGTIALTTQPECVWTAAADAAWITDVAPTQGQGSGHVGFRAAPNPNGTGRESALVINGQRATVRQSAAACQVTAASSSNQFAAGGGSGTITISTPAGCAWVVTVSQSWIAVSPTSGTGASTVSFTVASNTGASRTATVTAGGATLTLNQAGTAATGPAPSPSPAPAPPSSPTCSITLQPPSATLPAAGGSGVVSIATAAGCPWTAGSGASWIIITTALSSSGSGSLSFTVASNTSMTARTGTITVGGVSFTVNQAGTPPPACTVTVNPASRSVGATATSGSTSVSAPAGCPWTATSNAPWLTIASGGSGTGNGSVAFNVAANAGPSRTGTLTIGGQTFTVDQAGVCVYSINPSSRNFDKDGGTGTVAVAAPAGCGWTATSDDGWVRITAGESGTGNGTVTYVVSSYNGNGTRIGTMTIAGQTFTVTQKK